MQTLRDKGCVACQCAYHCWEEKEQWWHHSKRGTSDCDGLEPLRLPDNKSWKDIAHASFGSDL